MYPLNDEATEAIRRSHTTEIYAELTDAQGNPQASTTRDPKISLVPNVGNIQADRNASFTRQFSCQVVDPEGVLTPSQTQPYMDPLHRVQMRFWMDILLEGVFLQRIPMGVFVVEDCEGVEGEGEAGGGAVYELSGRSRAVVISENPWTSTFKVGGPGTSYSDGIRQIILDRIPSGTWVPVFKFENSPTTMPNMTFSGDDRTDPWEEARNLAQADGRELIEDATGAFVLRTVPNAKTLPGDWRYDESQYSSGVSGYKRSIKSSNVYSGVIVRGSAPWLSYQVQGVAWDTDPVSPTYFRGPFGMRPKQIDNPNVADEAQAQTAAQAELLNVIGVSEDVTIRGIVNPAHEVGDVLIVQSNILGVNDHCLLESFEIPFDVSQPMTGVTRRQRVA